MSYPVCKVKNISDSEQSIQGKIIQPNEIYTIIDNDRVSWATDDEVGNLIYQDIIKVYDANGTIESHMAQIAHLQNY